MQRARGEHWLLAPSSCPGLSITTSQILHLTCTISKSLAQVLPPCPLRNSTTLIFHVKPLGKPGFWGHTWRPLTGTQNALLCTLSITWQGWQPEPLWVLQVGSSAHLSCHPQSLSLAGCCKPSWAGREAPHSTREREGGGCLWGDPSWLGAWGVGGIPVSYWGAGESTHCPPAP